LNAILQVFYAYSVAMRKTPVTYAYAFKAFPVFTKKLTFETFTTLNACKNSVIAPLNL
jgi:hypothetical protein